MTNSHQNNPSRREFLKHSGRAAAVTAVAAGAVPHVHAAEDNTLQVALIGCGFRGTGAAANALAVERGPMKLVAMADVFPGRLDTSLRGLTRAVRARYDRLAHAGYESQIDVPEERRFGGFDAYKKAMDCLKPGDVVILATPPAFRCVHLAYAIEKGLHTFMEKPVTVDGPTTRRMYELAKQADRKNLKVAVGLMVRHCRGRQALYERIRDGEIGDIIAMRGYRMSGVPGRFLFSQLPREGESELLYQVRMFMGFLWASGGAFSDLYIHQIDELSWMKDAWPVSAHAVGGRHYRGDMVDQNFDTYSADYTYPDGTRLFFHGRLMNGCHNQFDSFAHGSKGTAIVSASAHAPGRVRTFSDQAFSRDKQIWAFPQPEPLPYQMQWEDLVEAIRDDKPMNQTERGARASLVTSMGRMAAHTGRVITYDEMLNCEHEFAPGIENFTMDSPAPVQLKDGRYPVPMPGMVTNQEYAT